MDSRRPKASEYLTDRDGSRSEVGSEPSRSKPSDREFSLTGGRVSEAATFCRERSAKLKEPLSGTAAESVSHWLMLEDASSSWGPKALKQCGLSPDVQARLQELSNQTGWRVNLIRRPSGLQLATSTGMKLFLARVTEGDRRWLSLDLQSAEELLQLDLSSLLENAPHISKVSNPHFFVCTHGVRDACCAKWGVPLFHAMNRKLPGQVWQCSHLGGHRFAPNVLALPYGLMYGRVELSEVQTLIAETVNGNIFDCSRLRGRVSHSQIVQAAEVFLRTAVLEREIDSICFHSLECLSEVRWRVQFVRSLGNGRSAAHSKIYSIELERRKATTARPVSCGDDIDSDYSYFVRS